LPGIMTPSGRARCEEHRREPTSEADRIPLRATPRLACANCSWHGNSVAMRRMAAEITYSCR